MVQEMLEKNRFEKRLIIVIFVEDSIGTGSRILETE